MANRKSVDRRSFIQQTGAAGVGFWVLGGVAKAESRSPNQKLNVGCIGAGGRGRASVDGCRNENIVALVDVDQGRLDGTAKKYGSAAKFSDYREMLDKMGDKIDAVTVGIPDHSHAPASVMALKKGKHVYCEKPLTHSVEETRVMRELAAEKGVVTQMGNQGTSNSNLRRSVEIIQAGGLGEVKELHVWTNRPVWPQSPNITARPKETPPVPKGLNWDAWLGAAPERPYHPAYHPFKWRGWWDFGTGALGDMACHTMNLVYMAMKLGVPSEVYGESEPINPETYPGWAKVQYFFPERDGGKLKPIKMTWYEGKKDGKKLLPPMELFQGQKPPGSGALAVGSEGTLFMHDDYGGRTKLLPLDKYKDYKGPAETLPRSPGHHNEWIQACKGEGRTMSNFNYAGPLTETILLGNVAIRVPKKKLQWDSKNLTFTNSSEATGWVKKKYRKGWSI